MLESKLFNVRESAGALTLIASILESSTEYSIIGKDLEGNILLWNEGARRIYGYEPGEVIGKVNSSILHTPEDARSGLPREISEIALRNGKWEGLIKRVRKNGDRFTARVVLTPRRDAAGNAVGLLLISKDVSAELQFAEGVRKAKLFDRAIVGNAQDAVDFITNILESSTEYSIIGKDLEGKILLWNEGARRLYGYEPDEVVGKANSSILHTAADVEAGKPAEMIAAALNNGKWEGTVTRLRKNGQQFPARVVITPRRDTTGKPVGLLLISKDISEEMRLTDELRAAQFYARSLIEASLDPLVTISPEGKITDVNEALVQATGLSREHLIGTDFSDYFTEPEKARAGYQQVFSQGFVRDYPLAIRHSSGRVTDVLYNASVYKDNKGVVLGVFAAARDVTERNRAEARQRAASAYARSLIEASLDPLVTISPEGKITDVNQATELVTGVVRQRLIGTDFSDYFTEPQRARDGYLQVISQGFVRDYPLVLRHNSGRVVDVLYNASLYRDDKGNVLGVFAAARDTTQRKLSEELQRASSAYARSLIEASLDPLVTISLDGKITDVNEASVQATGVEREQLIGTDFSEYFTEPEKARQGYKRVFTEGFVRDYPLAIRHVSGRVIQVLYNASIYKDEKGNVLGAFAAARDITAQKQASEYARSLIEASLDPLVTISAQGKITDVNDASVEATGVPRERLIGTDFSNFFTEPDKAREGYQRVFSEGFVRDYPLAIRHTSGRVTEVLYNASVYRDDKGGVLGVFAAARDVTERKRFEQTLQEKNVELENANMAKDRFLATMSHELRTPLNAIIGFTGTLLMRLPGPLTSDQEKQLTTVQNSGRHLLSLINDLLDLAKIESGKIDLLLEPVVCQDVMSQVVESLRPMAEEKQLKLEIETPQQDLILQTDRRTLSQILINLSNNAIKFTERGSVRLELSQRHGGDFPITEIKIVDSGIGIKPAHQAKLFQAFERGEPSAARRLEGTGLGLHLSQKLAGLIGARIECQSEFGKGSTFTVVIKSK